MAVDSAGNLYIADGINERIRKVAAGTGIITTVAGNGTGGYTGDGGPAVSAEISPVKVALDSAGNVYIANTYTGGVLENQSLDTVRKVTAATGIITTVAGTGVAGFSGDGGPATSAELNNPDGMAFDNAGNLYIADAVNDVIREMHPAPPTIIFPTVPVGATSPPVVIPLDINANGTIITGISTPVSQGGKQEYKVIGTGGCALNISLPTDTVCDVSVTFSPGYPGERPAPLQVVTSAGTFSFGMEGMGTGPQVALTPGTITTYAGNGNGGGDGNGGPAIDAMLSGPGGLVLDSAGNLYIADTYNDEVREVAAATGIITTIAGLSSGQGQSLNIPSGLALDAAGNLYIADYYNNRIAKLTMSTGVITTVAGNGTQGYSGDGGPAVSAQLNRPNDVKLDSGGNLYIADTYNNVIRKVAVATGTITTIAGDGIYGESGDGGPAARAELGEPSDMAIDSEGNLYITDNDDLSNRVRTITGSTSIISTIAGDGTAGYSGDGGPAVNAELHTPAGMAVDSAGNLYIADAGNTVVREVSAASGIISTVAGNGTEGYIGDGGPATSAEISPLVIALDSVGNLYIGTVPSSLTPPVPPEYRVRKVDVSAGLLNFASTLVGSTSTDSPRTGTVTNIGNGTGSENEELLFADPASGFNPSISNSDFVLKSGGSCPQLDPMSSPGADLVPGQSCTLLVSFTPTTVGLITGTMNISDNALNNPAVQIFSLNGTGSNGGPPGGGGPPSGTVGDFTLTATPAS